MITYLRYWGRIFVVIKEMHLLGTRTHLDLLLSLIWLLRSNLHHGAHERFEIDHLVYIYIYQHLLDLHYYVEPKRPVYKNRCYVNWLSSKDSSKVMKMRRIIILYSLYAFARCYFDQEADVFVLLYRLVLIFLNALYVIASDYNILYCTTRNKWYQVPYKF